MYTYDVDRTTGNPTEEGSGVTLDAISNPVLLPSANDHFIYVTGYDSGNVEWLWVYATEKTGDSRPYTFCDLMCLKSGERSVCPICLIGAQRGTVAAR